MREFWGQAIRFGAVGVLNTAVGFGLIVLAMRAGVSPLPANALGYAGGIVVSFLLNRAWTFGTGDRPRGLVEILRDAKRFLGAFSAAWSLNALVVWIALETTSAHPYLCQFAGAVTYSVSFFFLCRLWVFSAKA